MNSCTRTRWKQVRTRTDLFSCLRTLVSVYTYRNYCHNIYFILCFFTCLTPLRYNCTYTHANTPRNMYIYLRIEYRNGHQTYIADSLSIRKMIMTTIILVMTSLLLASPWETVPYQNLRSFSIVSYTFVNVLYLRLSQPWLWRRLQYSEI
jgi:hypothetical protein